MMRRVGFWMVLGCFPLSCATVAPPAPESAPLAATATGEGQEDQADSMADEWPIDDLPADGLALGGFAGGSAAKLTDLRETLLRYDGIFLRGWRQVLEDDEAPASEVHGALMELMTSVTGPTGLWRETIPNQWLGCKNEPDSDACTAFTKAATHFNKWDKFAKKLDHAPSNPKRFLVKSHGKIQAYIQTYVPADKNMTGVKETPFFQDHLAATLQNF